MDTTSASCFAGIFKKPKLPLCLRKLRRRLGDRSLTKVTPLSTPNGSASSSSSLKPKQRSPISARNAPRRRCWHEDGKTPVQGGASPSQGGSETDNERPACCISQDSSSEESAVADTPNPKGDTPVTAATEIRSHPSSSGGDGALKASWKTCSVDVTTTDVHRARPVVCADAAVCCALLLRAMTICHVIFNDVIGAVTLWTSVSRMTFPVPKDSDYETVEEQWTWPIRTRMRRLVRVLYEQAQSVQKMIDESGDVINEHEFEQEFTKTDEYFQEFREVASSCQRSKVLADFARAVLIIQQIINRGSFLSAQLPLLGRACPAVTQPIPDTGCGENMSLATDELNLDLGVQRLASKLARYRRVAQFVGDEVTLLAGALKKAAKRAKRKALRKEVGRKYNFRSNRSVAYMYTVEKIPAAQLVMVMPSIEEE